VVKGFDRLTRTGIAVLFVGIILVISVGLAFTQSPEIANPFVDTFNFNTVEKVFPMLRIGDDPRRGDSTVGGTPPTGEFVTCDNLFVDGQFCSDLLQSVDLKCKLKQAVEYNFVTGAPRTISSSDFDVLSPLFPDISLLSIIDPSVSREIVTLNVQPRLACDVPVLKDGTRVEFAITAESSTGLKDGKLKIKVSAYDEFGNLKTVISERQINIPKTIFADNDGISPIDGKELFIGSERILGDVNISADEIERALDASRDFNTRVIIELSGIIFIEVPDLNSADAKFVVLNDVGGVAGLTNPITLQLDLFNDIDEPAPEVPKVSENLITTVTSIIPDKLVVDGDAQSKSKVNVFFKMNEYSDAEGLPECEARQKVTGIASFFSQPLLAKVKATKQASTGFSTNFTCEIPVTGDTKTGTYEVKVSTLAVTPSGEPTRASTTTTFIVTLKIIDTGGSGGAGGAGDPCPTVPELRKLFDDMTDDDLLQQKANLQDKQVKQTANACDLIKFPLVIEELTERGLGTTGTPPPNIGGDNCDPPNVLTKIGENTFTCVKPSNGGGFGLPTFIACAEGVKADTSKGEICLPPSLFAIYQWLVTGNNWIIALVSIIAILIVFKVIAVAIGRSTGGVVLKP